MAIRTIKDVIKDFKTLIYFIEWLVYEQKAAKPANSDVILDKYGPSL